MKRKIIIILMAIISVFACVFGLSACGDNEGNVDEANAHHQHTYNRQVVQEKYLKSEATCTTKAIYYFSCECGETGEVTFEYGEAKGHTFSKQVTEEKYLLSQATCTTKAIYYYSCECGETGENTFEYGEVNGHTFNKQVIEEKYLLSQATCTAKAIYYYSCECGEKGAQTFEYGDIEEHTFANKVVDDKYLASQATCLNKAAYYYSCECGETGTQTFEYGELGEHDFGEDDLCKICYKHCNSNGLEYTLSEDGKYYILTGIGDCTDTDIYIADVYGDDLLPVTHIGGSVFSGCTTLKSIFIPASITNIGRYAFRDCNSLESVHITDISTWAEMIFGGDNSTTGLYDRLSNPLYYAHNLYLNGELVTEWTYPEGTKSIPDYAFSYCQSLKTITIPDSVTDIGKYAFEDCRIETATIPSLAVPYIKNINLQNVTITSGDKTGSFKDCTNLKKVVLGNSVREIGYQAFYNCTSLSEINIPSSVYFINSYAFVDCEKLETLKLPDSVVNIYENAFRGCSSLTEINIPDGVPYIATALFSGCSSLTYIRLPESVKYIQNGAFVNCINLSSINIPDGVTSIGESAFAYCTSLKGLSLPQSLNAIGKFAFCGCALLNITLPDGVTEIAEAVFKDCKDLSDIFTHENLTSIGNSAFAGCRLLNDIRLPEKLTFIGERAFAESGISFVFISGSVKTIGEYAFFNCKNLSNIQLSEGLTEIGESAFYGCSLFNLQLPATLKIIGKNAFENCINLDTLHIENIDMWWSLSFGNKYSNPLYYANNLYVANQLISQITVPDDITVISEYLFYNCEQLTTITIHDNVTSIGENAFSGCKIQNATIPAFAISYIDKTDLYSATVTSGNEIPESAFEDSGLFYLYLPDTLEVIGKNAFKNCTGLITVDIEDIDKWWHISFGNEYSHPHYYANNLNVNGQFIREITVPQDVTVISDYLFYNCEQISRITIHDNVTKIGENSFTGCKVGYVSLPAFAIPYIERNHLNEVNITSGNSIEDFAFSGCNLTNLIIPDSVTSIGDNSFQNGVIYNATLPAFALSYISKENLRSLEITSGERIEDSALSGCTGDLKRLLIPDSLKYIGTDAFAGCGWVQYNEFENSLYLGNETNPYVVLIKAKGTDILSCSINENTKFIYQDAFLNCKGISAITLPDKIISIGNSAFYGCRNLTNINIPDCVVSIGDHAFYGCGIDNLNIPKGVINIGSSAFSGCPLITLTIPETVKSIGNSAFSGCDELTNIILPNSLISIGDNAFNECISLTDIVIPSGLINMGTNVFTSCVKLIIHCEIKEKPKNWNSGWNSSCPVIWDCKNNNKDENNNIYTELDGIRYSLKDRIATVIAQKNDITFANIPSTVEYDNNSYTVTNINDYAFYYNELEYLYIPESIISVGERALRYVTHAVVPAFTISFIDKSYLQTIEIISGDKIQDFTFYECNSLEEIVLSDSITVVGERAFDRCYSLKRVYYKGTEADWNNISIGATNNRLVDATRYYYSEERPTDDGNYWHYVDGEVVVWVKE